MSQAWMLTVPRNVHKRALKIMIEKNDVKKWIIGFEEGKNGYRHYQIRLVSSNNDFFEWVKANIPTAHVEKASEERGDYERKSGSFISSDDTPEIRQIRFGDPRQVQEKILKIVNTQSDREIDVYLDPRVATVKRGFQYIFGKQEKHSSYQELLALQTKSVHSYVVFITGNHTLSSTYQEVARLTWVCMNHSKKSKTG